MEKIDYAIDIVDLSKSFKRQTLASGYTTIKSRLLNIFSTQKTKVNRTVAVDNLRLRIPKGSSVGIIGRNGSGKSTLLKLITGIYKPDKGYVKVNGRIAALIELGAGFHPDFTGRENLYLGGVLHGLSRKDIEARIPEIVEFAELQEVIDDPVRTYSSGMFMRLGFSLAIHTDPDVLLVDEVLAVGDASFNAKCKDKIDELHSSGKTLLLVTHDLDAVERWCDEAVWLHQGVVKDRGQPRRVIDHYREFVEKGEEERINKEERATKDFEEKAKSTSDSERWGSREIEITAVQLLNKQGEEHSLFHPDDGVTVEISYQVRESTDDYVFGVAIQRNDGTNILGTNTQIDQIKTAILSKAGKLVFKIDRLSLGTGEYYLDVAVHRKDGYPYDYLKNVKKFLVRSNLNQVGLVIPNYSWSL